jgi:hypothetical protein
MADIYRYEYYGKQTGWKYRIDIIPAGADALPSTPEIESLPPGSVSPLNSEWSFENNITLGMRSGITKEISIDTKLIPSGLKRALYYPIVSIVTQYEMTWGYHFNNTVDYGTVFIVSIQHFGNDRGAAIYGDFGEITGHEDPDFRLHYVGIQTDGISDVKTQDDFTVKLIDLFKFCCDNGKFQFEPEPYLDRKAYYDYIYLISSYVKAYAHAAVIGNHYVDFRFYKLKSMFDCINTTINTVMSYALRQTGTFVEINTTDILYFKQRYDAAGLIGDGIDADDLCVLGQVLDWDDSGAVHGGLFDYVSKGESSSLLSAYQNGGALWDFLQDYYIGDLQHGVISLEYESNLPKYTVTPIAVYEKLTGSTILEDLNDLLLKHQIMNPVLKFRGNTYKQLTASCYEKVAQDTDHFNIPPDTESTKSTRNGLSKTIPVVWNTNPMINDNIDWNRYGLTDAGYAAFGMVGISGIANNNIKWDYLIHCRNLFYFEKATTGGHDLTSIIMPIKVHEHCTIKISKTKTIGSYESGWQWLDYDDGLTLQALESLKEAQCKAYAFPYALFEAMKTILNSSVLTFDIPINNSWFLKPISDIGEVIPSDFTYNGIPFWNDGLVYKIDVAGIFNDDDLSDVCPYFKVTGSKIDDNNEIITVTLSNIMDDVE